MLGTATRRDSANYACTRPSASPGAWSLASGSGAGASRREYCAVHFPGLYEPGQWNCESTARR